MENKKIQKIIELKKEIKKLENKIAWEGDYYDKDDTFLSFVSELDSFDIRTLKLKKEYLQELINELNEKEINELNKLKTNNHSQFLNHTKKPQKMRFF